MIYTTLNKIRPHQRAWVGLTDEEIEDAYGAAAVADEVRCPECGYLTKHTEHIGCLRKQLSAINAFEQRNFAIVNMDKFPPASKPLTDEQISLDAHNIDPGDWNNLNFRNVWHEGFKEGARAAEAAHGIKGDSK